MTEEEPLRTIAPEPDEGVQLPGGIDTFGHDVEAQRVGCCNQHTFAA